MSRFTLAIGIALLVLEASVAVAILATSDEVKSPWLAITLAVSAGAAFVVSGLIALIRRPENRTGVLLAATGYVWFLGALSTSTNLWVFTVGFVLGNLVWVPFSALVLAYPTGRLETRLERAIPIAVGIVLIAPALFAALLDPRPAPNCSTCPDSAIAIADLPGAATALDAFTTVGGLALIAVVVTILVRRWRSASSALRRLFRPVIGAGIATLLAVALVVIAEQVSSTVADALQLLFFAAFAAVPIAFLFGILQSRLARSSVSDVVVALQAGVPLRDALATALGDPTLEVVYRLNTGRWVDSSGRRVPDPAESAGRKVTTVTRDGQPVAALVHDASLSEEPELIDAVTAAAGLSLHNERLQAELRAQYTFLETITDTAPSLLVNVDTEGRVLNHNQAAVSAAGYEDEEDVRGRHFWDVFIDESEREAMKARFAAAAPDFAAAEYENTFTNARGERLFIYWRSAPVRDEDGRTLNIVAGGLDITERKRFEEDLRASRSRIVEAEGEARRELERNLHDGAQQRLVALSVALRLVESKLRDDPEAASTLLGGAREELSQALEELRELARGIHPAVLTDRGLGPALEALVGRAGLPVDLETPQERLTPAVEAAAYYVVAEALTNVTKYGHASSAQVSVAAVDGVLSVTIADDGVGGADPARGSGLRGLADRVAALEGHLVVDSPARGGTRIRAEIPLPSATE